MRNLLMLIAALSLTATAAAEKARDYYMLGLSRDTNGRIETISYIDAASIASPTPNIRRTWTGTFMHLTAALKRRVGILYIFSSTIVQLSKAASFKRSTMTLWVRRQLQSKSPNPGLT